MHVLVPPYDAVRPLSAVGDRDLPLGSVVLAAGRSALAALGLLTLVEQRWPWIVPAVASRPTEVLLRESLMLVSDLRYRVALLGSSDDDCAAAAVVAAVKRRPFPPPDELARYVERRLGDPVAREILAGQFREAFGEPADVPSSATLSRFFSRHGTLTARDWRSLAVLARELSARAAGCPMLGGLVTSRTVDANARRFLGTSGLKASCRLGWESVFEQALRFGGYRLGPIAVTCSSQAPRSSWRHLFTSEELAPFDW
jgi:hypothetical protein